MSETDAMNLEEVAKKLGELVEQATPDRLCRALAQLAALKDQPKVIEASRRALVRTVAIRLALKVQEPTYLDEESAK